MAVARVQAVLDHPDLAHVHNGVMAYDGTPRPLRQADGDCWPNRHGYANNEVAYPIKGGCPKASERGLFTEEVSATRGASGSGLKIL